MVYICDNFISYIDYIVRNDRAWDRRCVGIDAMLFMNQLAYTAQPLPKIARVDLAAVFFSREKLAAENLAFGMKVFINL